MSIEVTQADRDAAHEWLRGQSTGLRMMMVKPRELYEAFARHRHQARAEQAAELAKFKALAETLAGALEHITDIEPDPANMGRFHDIANEALRQYKEIER